MAKIEITKDHGVAPSPTMADLQRGQLGTITGMPDTIHQGKMVMRLMTRVVELEYPHHGFSGHTTLRQITVRILPAGDVVTLTQEA